MAVFEMSARRRQPAREPARRTSRHNGIVRQFSTLAVLLVCFAINVGFVVQRDHRQANAAGPGPAADAHQDAHPNPRSDIPAAFKRISLSSEDAVAIGGAAGDLVNSAADGIETFVSAVWDSALWLSDRVLGYVADSWVNPATGDRVIFNAAPGAFNLAVAILALAMVAVVVMALAGPLYVSWRSWRLSRAHVLRFR